MAVGGVLLVAGVVGFLAVQSLDDADKWASVLSGVVAMAGLAVGVVTSVGGRPGRGRQSVTGSTVGGGVRQVRGVDGSVRMGPAGPAPAASTAGPPTPPVTSDGNGDGGQSVDGSQVSGSVDQIDQVGGDVELDR